MFYTDNQAYILASIPPLILAALFCIMLSQYLQIALSIGSYSVENQEQTSGEQLVTLAVDSH